jgi:hypothetical protein
MQHRPETKRRQNAAENRDEWRLDADKTKDQKEIRCIIDPGLIGGKMMLRQQINIGM